MLHQKCRLKAYCSGSKIGRLLDRGVEHPNGASPVVGFLLRRRQMLEECNCIPDHGKTLAIS